MRLHIVPRTRDRLCLVPVRLHQTLAQGLGEMQQPEGSASEDIATR